MLQSMQHQIAQVVTELESARLLVYNAARLVDAKQDFLQAAAMAKLVASGKSVYHCKIRNYVLLNRVSKNASNFEKRSYESRDSKSFLFDLFHSY